MMAQDQTSKTKAATISVLITMLKLCDFTEDAQNLQRMKLPHTELRVGKSCMICMPSLTPSVRGRLTDKSVAFRSLPDRTLIGNACDILQCNLTSTQGRSGQRCVALSTSVCLLVYLFVYDVHIVHITFWHAGYLATSICRSTWSPQLLQRNLPASPHAAPLHLP